MYLYEIITNNIIAEQCLYEWDVETIIWMTCYRIYGPPIIGKIWFWTFWLFQVELYWNVMRMTHHWGIEHVTYYYYKLVWPNIYQSNPSTQVYVIKITKWMSTSSKTYTTEKKFSIKISNWLTSVSINVTKRVIWWPKSKTKNPDNFPYL